MKNFLLDDECYRLISEHKKERDKQICDRIKAILLHNKRWTLMQNADALLLLDYAIHLHIKEYHPSQKLKLESRGSVEKLTQEQSKNLTDRLQIHTYFYITDIIVYVKSFYKISYIVSGMRCWLKCHAFSYKKPVLISGKASEEQQK